MREKRANKNLFFRAKIYFLQPLRPIDAVYAHERKPFFSRVQTFFIVSVSLFCRDKKGAPQMFAAYDVHSEGDKIKFLDNGLATCGFCRARAEEEGESRSNRAARKVIKIKESRFL